jgi:hypothetical protein
MQRLYVRREVSALRISPVMPDLVRALTTSHHAGAATLTGTYGIKAVATLMGKTYPEGLYTRATFEPVVRQVMRNAGYIIERTGPIAEQLPEPVTLPATIAPVDSGLLQLVQEQEWGLIRYQPAAVDPARLIAQVVLAWPTMRMAVVERRIDDARCLRRRLRALGIDAGLLTSRDAIDRYNQVVVTTPIYLADLPVEPEWLECIIVMDAFEATSGLGMLALSHAWRARMYGLIDVVARPAPFDQDHLHLLFGFHEITIPAHGCQERPVQLLRYPIRGGMTLPVQLGGIQLQRRGLWHNAVRNRKLVRIADAFAKGDQDKLVQMLGKAVGIPANPASVVLLVQTVEHALELAQQLPGWRVAAGSSLNEEGLTAEQIARLHPAPDPFRVGPLRAIATAAVLERWDLRNIDVLVRADGGIGLPPLSPWQLGVAADRPVRPLLLIDCHDQHHPLLRRQSRARLQAYEERGWNAPGIDPVQARVQRFLASRTGGGQ